MPQPTPPAEAHKLTLYGSVNSDCSTRLRLALAIKGLQYTYIDCGSPFSHSDRPENYAELNPTGAVPTLVLQAGDGTAHAITQSVAAIEYLDETYPSPCPLLPESPLARAQTRALAAIIASDTHPLIAPRVTRQLASQFADSPAAQRQQAVNFVDWNRQWVRRGLEAYERTVMKANLAPGRYSMGDEVSLADICLLPQAWRARGYDIQLEDFPVIQKVVGNLEDIECLRAAHWDRYG